MLFGLLLSTSSTLADGWGGQQIEEEPAQPSSLAEVEVSETRSLEAAGGGVIEPAHPYTAAEVQTRMRSAWPGLLGCYAASGLDERIDVDLQLHVNSAGEVTKVEVEGLDEELTRCVSEEGRLLRFPPHDEETVVVTAPIWLG